MDNKIVIDKVTTTFDKIEIGQEFITSYELDVLLEKNPPPSKAGQLLFGAYLKQIRSRIKTGPKSYKEGNYLFKNYKPGTKWLKFTGTIYPKALVHKIC